MLKKGDVDDDADDDNEVRTSASRSCATAALITVEFFLRTQYLQLSPHISGEVWGGTGIRCSTQYL
jgi:hypothetical protein